MLSSFNQRLSSPKTTGQNLNSIKQNIIKRAKGIESYVDDQGSRLSRQASNGTPNRFSPSQQMNVAPVVTSTPVFVQQAVAASPASLMLDDYLDVLAQSLTMGI